MVYWNSVHMTEQFVTIIASKRNTFTSITKVTFHLFNTPILSLNPSIHVLMLHLKVRFQFIETAYIISWAILREKLQW